MANASPLKKGGKRLASMLDAVAERESRPSVDERLANLRADRKERGARARKVRWVSAAALSAVLCGLAFGLVFKRRTLDLTFSVDRIHAESGAWISAGVNIVPIAFSDGSEIDLRPSSHARVESIDARGARVLLERGTLSAAIVHHEGSAWAVLAGPFEVHVIGTRFDASWDPSTESLSVALTEGHVEVTGTCLRESRPVRTGETVRLSCRDVVATNNLSTTPESAASATPTSGPEAMSSSSTVPTALPINSANGQSAGATVDAPSWQELARKGDYGGAFDKANQAGVESLLTNGSVSDLSELSDVARLAKKPDIARRVALALRDRFAGSDAAAQSAFQLGRMSVGAPSEAEKWFQVYLAERPSGPFEPEALGRILELQNSSGQTEAARATASTYLVRHPNGAHAALAHSILEP